METAPPSQSRTRQILEIAVEAGLNVLPFGGGASVILMAGLRWNLNKRTERFLTEVAEGLDELSRRFDGFDPRTLAENESFIDALTIALSIALRTSKDEKKRALCSAVLNSALPAAPSDDLKLLFLHLVDRFTPGHLRLLTVLNDPNKHIEQIGRFPSGPTGMHDCRMAIYQTVLPHLANDDEEFAERLYSDLRETGLVRMGIMAGPEPGTWAPDTTNLGRRFLGYVTEPDELAWSTWGPTETKAIPGSSY